MRRSLPSRTEVERCAGLRFLAKGYRSLAASFGHLAHGTVVLGSGPMTAEQTRGFEPSGSMETERLILRTFVPGDLDAVLAIYAHPDVVRYLYEEPLTQEQAAAALQRRLGMHAIRGEGEGLRLAAILKSTHELIGDCSLFWLPGGHRQAEIGFVFDPAHQGHGYATEASHVLLRIAFGELRLHRVVGRTEARNAASARVLEKLGMRHEAHLIENEWVKDEWQSELIYAILDREWLDTKR
jgi:RimJ/RimL family protein N-acetyltransferase